MKENILRKLIFAIILLGLIGLIDAIYLTTKYYTQSSVFCSWLNNGCDLVTSSRYASFWGIPIALVGAIYYALIIFLAVSLGHKSRPVVWNYVSILSAGGFMFSLWLLYLQIFIIRAICFYCIISAAASILIFIISLIYSLKNNKNE